MRKILKELGTHSLTYFVGSVALSASSILLLPLYTRNLSKADYGVLEIIDSMSSMLIILFMAGLGAAYGKLHNESPDDRGRQEVFGTTFWFILASSSVWIGALLAMRTGLAKIILGDAAMANLLSLGLAAIWTNSIYVLGTYYLNVHKQPRLFLVFSLAKLLVNVILNLIFLLRFGMGAAGMLLGDLLSTLLVGAVLYRLIISRNGLPFNASLLREAMIFGLPYVPSLLCATIMHRADRYLLLTLASLEDVGVYGIGYKFPFMLGGLLLQSFMRIYGSSTQFEIARQANSGEIFAKVTTYFFTIVTVSEFTLAIFGTTLLRLLATPAYYPAAPVIQILAAGFCIYALHTFFSVPAVIKDKTWYLPISYFAAGATSLAMDLLLIPRFGYLGSAWGMVAAYTVFSAVLYLTLNRFYPVPYEFGRMGILFAVGVAVLSANHFLAFERLWLEIPKQCAFAAALPAFVLFGPFLRAEEITGLANMVARYAPGPARAYSRLRGVQAATS